MTVHGVVVIICTKLGEIGNVVVFYAIMVKIWVVDYSCQSCYNKFHYIDIPIGILLQFYFFIKLIFIDHAILILSVSLPKSSVTLVVLIAIFLFYSKHNKPHFHGFALKKCNFAIVFS